MAGIAKMRSVVIDCSDPVALAEFYAALVGGAVTPVDDDWVTLRDGVNVILAFQLAPDHKPPTWPDPERPQQFHIDVTVEDVETAEAQVLALGATKADQQPPPDERWRVFLDPAGHPFCLCWD
jgi:catechol-2,3-dioxygenase